MSLVAFLLLLISYYSAADGLSPDGIVLFGDSLSDNGNDFAGNVKFVLRTNQARTRLMILSIHIGCPCSLQGACDNCCEGQRSVKHPSEALVMISADVPRGALLHGQMVQWTYMDRVCGLTAGSQPH